MELLDHIRQLRRDIEDAIDDGRISFIEATKIAVDIVHILQIILPVLVGGIDKAQKQAEGG